VLPDVPEEPLVPEVPLDPEEPPILKERQGLVKVVVPDPPIYVSALNNPLLLTREKPLNV
jgi:hypothetical protein